MSSAENPETESSENSHRPNLRGVKSFLDHNWFGVVLTGIMVVIAYFQLTALRKQTALMDQQLQEIRRQTGSAEEAAKAASSSAATAVLGLHKSIDDSKSDQDHFNTQIGKMQAEVKQMESLAQSTSRSAVASEAQVGKMGSLVEAAKSQAATARKGLEAYQTLTNKTINLAQSNLKTAQDNLVANTLESKPYVSLNVSRFDNVAAGQVPKFVMSLTNTGRTRAYPVRIEVVYGLISTMELQYYLFTKAVQDNPSASKIKLGPITGLIYSGGDVYTELDPSGLGGGGMINTTKFNGIKLTPDDFTDLHTPSPATVPGMLPKKTLHVEVRIAYKNDLHRPEESYEDALVQAFNWNPETNEANFAPAVYQWSQHVFPVFQPKNNEKPTN